MIPALPTFRTPEQNLVRSVLTWQPAAPSYALPANDAQDYFRQRVFGPRALLTYSTSSAAFFDAYDLMAFAAAHG
jgi:hypothetical protein